MKKVQIITTILLTFLWAMMPIYLTAQSLQESYKDVTFIDISTVTGDITIKKGDTKEVKVDGKWDEEQVKVRLNHSGDFLTINVKNKSNNTDSNASNWVLWIPDGLKIDVTSGTGSLNIAGVEGVLKVTIGTGDIEVSDMKGKFDINSGTGEIEITNASGKFDLISGTNDVIVKNSEGKFDANSGTGDVQFEQVNPTRYSSLNSGTGDVYFEVSTKIGADLSIKSGTGDAILDFHGNKIEGDFEMKCGIRSGEIIAPFSFDSEVQVGKRNNGYIEKEAKIGNGEYDLEISTGTGKAEVKS